MFITKYYITGAIVAFLLVATTSYWYFSIFFLWVGLSLAAVSFAYIVDSPAIFRKKQDGSIPMHISWIFYPFLLGTQLYNSWARRNDKVPAIQKISDKLYLACRLFPSDIEYLKNNGVGAILDATAEFSGLNYSSHDENLAYLNIPILDHSAPHKSDLQHAINWIDHQISIGNAVAVHCALGRGRSVLIMAAYLLAKTEFDSLDEVLEHINKIRGTARLNSRQYKKLAKLHENRELSNKQSALIIVNPKAGGGKWKEYSESILQRLSVKYSLTVLKTQKDKSAAEQINKRDLNKFDVVVACGGDGTVNDVASVLINTKAVMAIVPLGTTNALAHVVYGLKSKFDPISDACESIMNGKTMSIDTAICNEDIVLLVVGIGFEEKMVSNAHRKEKDKDGQLAYIKALVSAVGENKSGNFQVSIDNAPTKDIKATSIVVANAAPSTTLLAQGGSQPDFKDGLLDLTIIDTQESIIIPMLALSFRSLKSANQEEQPGLSNLQYQRVKSISIKSDKPIDYVVDGEVRQSKEISIQINPSSLNLIRP